MLINTAIAYINSVIDKNDTVLFLPEGNLINFITGAKVDLHCYMIDRLYFEAYGENKSIEKIKKSNPDYIMLVNFSIYNFHQPYMYEKDTNKLVAYIYANYIKKMEVRGRRDSRLIILKRMTADEKKEYDSMQASSQYMMF